MTEDEAAKRVCCGPEGCGRMTGNFLTTDVAFVDSAPTRERLCIGSACMAWRWAGYRAKDGTWIRKTAEGPWDPSRADGHCGLAGTPQ